MDGGGGDSCSSDAQFHDSGMQREWSRYTAVESMPAIEVKAPAAPVLPVAKAEKPKPAAPKAAKPRAEEAAKPAKGPQRFEGPQISLAIPADVRAKVPEEARVQVIVAIDEQGNVTNAEVASVEGQGAAPVEERGTGGGTAVAIPPGARGERPVESQMVLTYLFKPASTEF